MKGLWGSNLLFSPLGHSSAHAVKPPSCAHSSRSRSSQPLVTAGEVRSSLVGGQEPAVQVLEVPRQTISGRDKAFSAPAFVCSGPVLVSSGPLDSISAASQLSSAVDKWISGVVEASSAVDDGSSGVVRVSSAEEDASTTEEYAFTTAEDTFKQRKSPYQQRKTIPPNRILSFNVGNGLRRTGKQFSSTGDHSCNSVSPCSNTRAIRNR